MGTVDRELDREPVVTQQHCRRRIRFTAVSDERLRPQQGGNRTVLALGDEGPALDAEHRHARVRPSLQGYDIVEKSPDPSHYPLAAVRIVRTGSREVTEYVGGVDGVVERVPTGVSSVECVTSIGGRHHQLRSGDLRDLSIDACRSDLERWADGSEVADRLEHLPISRRIMRRTDVLTMPVVNRRLKAFPGSEQFAVSRSGLAHYLAQPPPELGSGYLRARQSLVVDEVVQDPVDSEIIHVHV